MKDLANVAATGELVPSTILILFFIIIAPLFMGGEDGTLLAGLPVLVHLRRDFLACDKALRAQIAQPAVRSFHVVMLSPILNDDAGFA